MLESILSKEACQKQLPTLDNLIDHRFFAEYAPRFSEQYSALIASNRPHFKLSAQAKEQMKIATQKIEQRLQNEQKSVSVKLVLLTMLMRFVTRITLFFPGKTPKTTSQGAGDDDIRRREKENQAQSCNFHYNSKQSNRLPLNGTFRFLSFF